METKDNKLILIIENAGHLTTIVIKMLNYDNYSKNLMELHVIVFYSLR